MPEHKKLTIFITGAAGYVGSMLADRFSKMKNVQTIIGLDKELIPDLLKENKKIVWITANTSDKKWQDLVSTKNPDVIINCAWQIREMYGRQKTQWLWNVEGSNDVFDFAFNTPSVKKLVHFSTVSSYGALPENTFEKIFTENSPFIEDEYLYGIEKKTVEENLKQKYQEAKKGSAQVFIVRPAAITGPKGRFMRNSFGLQAALSGQLKGSFLYRIISIMVSFVPVTKNWVRQFIHEDDVTGIVSLFVFNNLNAGYEVFNISPPGKPVYGTDMAKAVGKKTVMIYPWMIRVIFFWFWHLARGRVPTSKGGWKFYSYPIIVDGSKLTRKYGYKYTYKSKEAFTDRTRGYYAKYIK